MHNLERFPSHKSKSLHDWCGRDSGCPVTKTYCCFYKYSFVETIIFNERKVTFLRDIIIDEIELQIGRLDLPSECPCLDIHAKQVKARG